ncbi:MAG: formate/nitrite transporter family protein [Lachnospiraceae bacterium]|nr:formate/nitrite transporter family protein [Lachnospiraceae bacterium]
MKVTNTISQVMEQYSTNIVKKAEYSAWGLFARAILAGAMIAFGAEASNVAAHGIADVGLARTVAGVVFPIGLMMVILMGAELFTGDCMLVIGVTEKIISLRKLIVMLVTIWIGNFAGGALISALTYFSNQFNYSGGGLGAYTIKVAVGKTGLSFGTAFVSGILCNILVCAAVLMAMCATDVAGKILASFFIIFAFVISGFEHCVANMYYITAGLICKLNPDYVSVSMGKYGLTEAQLASLNIKTFLINNLVPVTLGNIVGGALLVGIPLYYINVGRKKH